MQRPVDCVRHTKCANLSPYAATIGDTPVPIDLIFAHQYGWDEALLFVVPIAIAVVVVRRLDKKSRREEKPPSEED